MLPIGALDFPPPGRVHDAFGGREVIGKQSSEETNDQANRSASVRGADVARVLDEAGKGGVRDRVRSDQKRRDLHLFDRGLAVLRIRPLIVAADAKETALELHQIGCCDASRRCHLGNPHLSGPPA